MIDGFNVERGAPSGEDYFDHNFTPLGCSEYVVEQLITDAWSNLTLKFSPN